MNVGSLATGTFALRAFMPSLCLCLASGFGGIGALGSLPVFPDTALGPFLDHSVAVALSASTSPSTPALSTAATAASEIFAAYKESLALHPLQTKMATGAVLAVAGDAIAQSRDPEEEYDTRRAASFMVFDMAYRALQHNAFPVIVELCRGQFFLGAVGLIPPLAKLVSDATNGDPSYFAAMEQTLASQLGVVPFMYYPVFFALTGAVQGLTTEEAILRAKETFVPLMKRNLFFWVPVQFVQFGFVEEGLQIPFLSVCGLVWTFILSVMAGSTKSYKTSHSGRDYCVTGEEPGCILPDEELFPIIEIEEAVINTEHIGVNKDDSDCDEQSFQKDSTRQNEVIESR